MHCLVCALFLPLQRFSKPVIISVAAGVDSVGDPSVNTAKHFIIVPLYSGMAGMCSASTRVPLLSWMELVTSGYSAIGDPLIRQPIIASDRR